jgi:hypothetical protein
MTARRRRTALCAVPGLYIAALAAGIIFGGLVIVAVAGALVFSLLYGVVARFTAHATAAASRRA